MTIRQRWAELGTRWAENATGYALSVQPKSQPAEPYVPYRRDREPPGIFWPVYLGAGAAAFALMMWLSR